MKIRCATEEDRLPLFKLAAAMHAETDFRHFNFDPQKALNNLGEWIHSPRARMLIADSDGDVVGLLAGSIQETWFGNDTFVNEQLLFVRPDKRGGRAAYMLVRDFVAWWRETGVKHIRMGVSTAADTGPAAERLYTHFGLHYAGGNYSAHLEEAKS